MVPGALCSYCLQQTMVQLQRYQVIFCNEGLGSFKSVIAEFCSRSAKVFCVTGGNNLLSYLMKSPFALMQGPTYLLSPLISSMHKEFKTEKRK